jgi:CRISPR-associated protein Cmr1
LKRSQWQVGSPILHPEVPLKNVDAFLYMGYGPVTLPKGAKAATLKKNAAIQANESAQLRLAYPKAHSALLEQALWLMDRYGTLGGRSRNGWGSFSLTPENNTPALIGTLPLQNWTKGLDRDWPHAIGKNEKGALIWQTAPQADWKKAMVELAKLKVGLRTQFAFTTGKNASKTEERHWLSYPVTNHSVAAWGNNLRLPNSLRFKVRPVEKGQVVGVIFHVPCLPPGAFHPNRGVIENVWKNVHKFLDTHPNGLSRIQE